MVTKGEFIAVCVQSFNLSYIWKTYDGVKILHYCLLHGCTCKSNVLWFE